MDPMYDGCRLCLDLFAECFTTIDNMQLKHQMETVFCFSIESKQGYCSGVCHSCSYAISEFYTFSEKVRQNQELLNGNVSNCDRTIDSKVTLGSVKVKTLNNSELQETAEDTYEPKDEDLGAEEVPNFGDDKLYELHAKKLQGQPGKIKLEDLEAEPSSQNQEALKGNVAIADPTVDANIALVSVKVETPNYSGIPQTTENACEPKVETSKEESSTLDSKITIENVKVELIGDYGLPETTKGPCEPKHEVSGEEDLTCGEDESNELMSKKAQIKQKGRSKKRNLADLESDEATTSSKQTITNKKLTQQERNEEDQLFNKHFRMVCDLCGTSAVTYTELASHFRKEHNRNGYVVCCNKKLFKRSVIREHIDFHANPDAFRCEVCGNKYKTKDNLTAHVIYRHSRAGLLKCDYCSQSFAEKPALAKHMKRHVKVECPKCNKMFANKRSLNTHMTKMHSDKDRTMVCDTCGQEFLSKQYFDQHMNEHIGIEVQRFQCGICQRWLKGKRNFRDHMNMVHTDGNRELQCDICLQNYPHARALYKHKRVTHGEPKHECELCGKKFKKAISLKEHRTSHTGEVLYACDYCGIPTNSMTTLYEHIKKNHPTEWLQKKLMATHKSGPSGM